MHCQRRIETKIVFVAFILSALLIGLIGFGVCALMLSNRSGMQ
jgi:hypothetical protein